MTNVTTLSTSHRVIPMSWVESLFSRMQAMYGNKFLDMWRDTNIETIKALWAEEMGRLSNEEMKRGFAALMLQDWPPSLPTYIKLCKPSIDPLVAYYEAVAGVQARSKGEIGEWSHPAIYWAAMPLSFDLGTQTYSQIKVRWDRALAGQMERGEWAEILAPKLALEAPGKGDLSREKAAQMLNELGASGVLSKTGRDEKRWAKRVLERIKRGDKTVTMIQRKFAEEALQAGSA